MSRSFKVHRHTFKKVPDKVHPYKCTCSWCVDNKMKQRHISDQIFKEEMKNLDPYYWPYRDKFVYMYVRHSSTQGSPKRVDIDLTKAKQKIKMKLKMLR